MPAENLGDLRAFVAVTQARSLTRAAALQIELSVDYALTDIAAHRFDAGVRIGSGVDKDMIAVRIAPDLRMAVVAPPECLAGKPPPVTPQDLVEHRRINLRLPTHGGLYAWDFEKDGQAMKVRVGGQTAFNNTFLMLQAAGFAYVPLGLAQPHIDPGRLGLVAAVSRLPTTPTVASSRRHWRW